MAAGKGPHQRCRWRSWSACPAGCWSPAPCPCPCPRACWATASGSRPPPGCTAERGIFDGHLWNKHMTPLLPGTASEPEVGSAAAAGGDSRGCMVEIVWNISLVSSRAPQPHFQSGTAQGTSSEGKDAVPHLDEHDVPDLQHIGVVLVDERRGVTSADAVIVQLCSGEVRRRMPLFYQFGRTSGGRDISASGPEGRTVVMSHCSSAITCIDVHSAERTHQSRGRRDPGPLLHAVSSSNN